MPIHDWTRVDAGIFHDFHLAWIAEIREATYRAAWEGVPVFWRDILTAPPANGRKKPGGHRKRKG
jgi:hypothetical protein